MKSWREHESAPHGFGASRVKQASSPASSTGVPPVVHCGRRHAARTRSRDGCAFLIAACLCLPASLLAKPKEPAVASTSGHANHNLSEEFFTNGPIPHLRIEVKGTNFAALQRNNRVYVRATVRDGNTVYEDVGIHLKGAAGSFRDLNDTPALTLNFDKFQEHQKFHGLDKVHLNNSVQDASYMTELLCGELFRAAGVPAARTTHARVQLNGRDLGLYVL